MVNPLCDALISIENNGQTSRYFLEIFDDIPSIFMRKRVKEYLEYYNSDAWQDNTDNPFPEIIIICPSHRIKSHLYHFIQYKLGDDEEPVVYLAVREEVVIKGLSDETLQKVLPDE